MGFYSVSWHQGRCEWLLHQYKTAKLRNAGSGQAVVARAVPQDLADALGFYNARQDAWYGRISTTEAAKITGRSRVLKNRRKKWRTQSS